MSSSIALSLMRKCSVNTKTIQSVFVVPKRNMYLVLPNYITRDQQAVDDEVRDFADRCDRMGADPYPEHRKVFFSSVYICISLFTIIYLFIYLLTIITIIINKKFVILFLFLMIHCYCR